MLLHLGAGDRADLDLRLLHLGKEIRIFHHAHEAVAQRGDPVGRHAWRRDEGPGQERRQEDHIERLAVVGVGHEIRHQRNAGRYFRHGLRSELRQEMDAAVLEPLRPHRVQPFHVPDPAGDLALLERDQDLAAARIAGHDLQVLQAEHVLDGERQHVGVAGPRHGADHQPFALEVVERTDPRRLPRDQHRRGAHRIADHGHVRPFELSLGLGAGKQRIEYQRRIDRPERGAVARRALGQIVGEHHAAGPGHVLDHDLGRAGQIARQELADLAGVEIVGAADSISDVTGDGPAAVELRDGLLRVCAGGQRRCGEQQPNQPEHAHLLHLTHCSPDGAKRNPGNAGRRAFDHINVRPQSGLKRPLRSAALPHRAIMP